MLKPHNSSPNLEERRSPWWESYYLPTLSFRCVDKGNETTYTFRFDHLMSVFKIKKMAVTYNTRRGMTTAVFIPLGSANGLEIPKEYWARV
jgi:hypothetical protein